MTVAFSLSISGAIGFPTILLLPITTQCFPEISILLLFKSSIIPAGVHDTNPFLPITSEPTLTGEKPSTSFLGDIDSITRSSSICPGSGSWQSIPWTLSSLLSLSISASNSSCVVFLEVHMIRILFPHTHMLFLFLT